jgi:hypothetical protein
MGTFEYAMVLVSIIIGLALTHILSALGAAVHRLRGHGDPIRLEAVYLFWVGYVLIWLVSFWWFEFRFQALDVGWTYGLYLFLILYAICLFLVAVILIPSRMVGIRDSYEYFMAGRKWFFGAVLFGLGIDQVDSFLKGVDWGLRPLNVGLNGTTITLCIVGMVAESRRLQLGVAAAALAIQLAFMFWGLPFPGSG